MITSGGASSLVLLKVEDEPICMLTTVSVSSHAAHSGSQASLCTLGRPRAAGFSEKAMACDPCAAQRRTSCAARSGSHIGIRVSGIRRPRASSAHHSPIIQSL